MTNIDQTGFSLVEMAVVLAIIGMVIGGVITPITVQLDLKRVNDTRSIMDSSKETLIGYAMSHTATDGRPYLPCPDTSGDGLEEARTAGACPSQEGRLPWATLGSAKTDAWGNLLRYRVHPSFSSSSTGFTLTTTGTLQVCESSACSTVVASALPVVIVSHGKNGYGARSELGNVIAVPSTASADELENIDGRNNPTAGNNNSDTADTSDVNFVSRYPNASFDDLVTWISANTLYSKMVAAGKLP